MIGNASAKTSRGQVGRAILGGLAIVFGLATVREGGMTLFGGAEARAAAGAVVPFVLAFNFGAAFGYLVAGAATVANRGWAIWIARALAGTSALVLLALAAHVLGGGAYETRTPIAMTIRTAFWAMQAILLPRVLAR